MKVKERDSLKGTWGSRKVCVLGGGDVFLRRGANKNEREKIESEGQRMVGGACLLLFSRKNGNIR